MLDVGLLFTILSKLGKSKKDFYKIPFPKQTNFTRPILTRPTLTRANLTRANLTRANLTRAN